MSKTSITSSTFYLHHYLPVKPSCLGYCSDPRTRVCRVTNHASKPKSLDRLNLRFCCGRTLAVHTACSGSPKIRATSHELLYLGRKPLVAASPPRKKDPKMSPKKGTFQGSPSCAKNPRLRRKGVEMFKDLDPFSGLTNPHKMAQPAYCCGIPFVCIVLLSVASQLKVF